MGLYDDVANIKAMKETTGEDKVFYIGYSEGTIHMFYGLSHLEDEFHADNLHKVVQLAPCFVISGWPAGADYFSKVDDLITDIIGLGVYATNGPNWEADLKTICDNSSHAVCRHYHG